MDYLSLSAEEKLLLYCSRLKISDEIKYKIEKILSYGLDWNFVLEYSLRQGISPLVYWNLREISVSKNIPPEVMQILLKTYYNNLARNLRFYNELSKILNAFKEADIDTIVMKGAFLAEVVYKNIGLRSMNDIDLLINADDLQKAKKELGKLMYFNKIVFPTKSHEQFITALEEELQFINEAKKIVVEIHWNIQPPLSHHKVNVYEFWGNAKSVEIVGIETLTFGPENLLQHLCLHLDKHLSTTTAPPAKSLRDYCDIAELTKYYKEIINWNYLLQSSKDYGIEEPIYRGLYIANNYFGAFIPEDIVSKLQPININIEFKDMFKGKVEGNSIKNCHEPEIKSLISLKQVNGNLNRLRITFGYVFPSKEYMVYRYSIKDKKQVYLFYLSRSRIAFTLCLKTVLRQLSK